MAKIQKKRSRGSPKCKTVPPPKFRQSWCEAFLGHALKSADVESSCKLCEVGIGEYLTARRTDPAFELACLELDVIVRAAAVAVLECAAAKGEANTGKLKLLMAGIESLRAFGDEPAVEKLGDLPEWIVEEILRFRDWRESHPDVALARYSVMEFCGNTEFLAMKAYADAIVSDAREAVRIESTCQAPECGGVLDKTCRKCKQSPQDVRRHMIFHPDPEDD